MISETGFIAVSVPGKIKPVTRIRVRHYVDNKRIYFAVKRFFDIVVSVIIIMGILSWLLPVMAVLIKFTSRGPVFFLQKRVGRGGRSFTCYKFRTMVLNTRADIQQASENDERVTSIGLFLRRSNLDEFPQFFNVLLGSMSIVGPRPHMHTDCSKFSSMIPRYKLRNLVKPGITGLSQVKGYHGVVVSKECITRRYQWDAFYVRNINFGLDLKIVVLTAIQRLRFFIRL
jgi:putative colanic acid biosysnthesis UDP-glucose lipid carrier transferase